MGCLVMQNVHVGLDDSHEDKRNRYRPPRRQSQHPSRHDEWSQQYEDDRQRVPAIIYPTQLGAELWSRSTVATQEVTTSKGRAHDLGHPSGHRRDELLVGRSRVSPLSHVIRVPIARVVVT